MPTHDGPGLHENEARSPVLPDSREENPEDAIGALGLWPLNAPLKDQQLVPQGEVLEDKLGTLLGEAPQEGEKESEEGHR